MANNLGAAREIVEDFLLHSPLYLPKNINEEEFSVLALHVILYQSLSFDVYCIHCKDKSPFKRQSNRTIPFERYKGFGVRNDDSHPRNPSNETWETEVQITCQREPAHKYTYYLRCDEGEIQKVGQYPSLEDIAGADIERFRTVLDRAYFAELHRAGGLASHGIGIGSFVYLRRIFERLISTHYEQFSESNGPIAGFEGYRFAEKISALSAVLPSAVVELKDSYGILSKGLHELDEETCRRFFPVVRAAIVAILEQDLQETEKRKSQAALRLEMSKITAELKSSPPKTTKDKAKL